MITKQVCLTKQAGMPTSPLHISLWEQITAEHLSERFQPCLVLAESDLSMSECFQPCLVLAEAD